MKRSPGENHGFETETKDERESPPRFFHEDERESPVSIVGASGPKQNSPGDTQELVDKNNAEVDSPNSFEFSIRSILGEEVVPKSKMKGLYDASNGDVETAINIFYDNSLDGSFAENKDENVETFLALQNSQRIESTTRQKDKEIPTSEADDSSPVNSQAKNHNIARSSPRNASLTSFSFLTKSNQVRKYVGCFGVEAYSIVSGSHILQAGERAYLERQKAPTKTQYRNSRKRSKTNNSSGLAYTNSIRFLNSDHKEIGKLPSENAHVLCTLMSQKLWSFEASCIYADDFLHLGSNVTLQIYCFLDISHPSLNQSPFSAKTAFIEDDPAAFIDTQNKRDHLLRLFSWIALEPYTENSVAGSNVQINDLLLSSSSSANPTVSETSSSDVTEDDDAVNEQLSTLYDRTRLNEANLPSHAIPEGFRLDLREYQKQALYWMCQREKGDAKVETSSNLHPLWSQFLFPMDPELSPEDYHFSKDDEPHRFFVNLYTGDITLVFPSMTPYHRGGILADEMGLGKTIEMLSLIHARRSSDVVEKSIEKSPFSNRLPKAAKTTLVVAPMSLLDQWQSEAVKVSNINSFKTLVYYGSDTSTNLQSLATNSAPDLVITSYGVLLSESSNTPDASGLFSVHWHRVILDEGHSIKNPSSKTAKACYAISAQNRWVITGTPIVNKLDDLYSMIKFLQIEPWCNYNYWRTFVSVPYEAKDILKALNVVQSILEPLVLRRTKETKDISGSPIVCLPDRKIETIYLEFSEAERRIYDSLYVKAKSRVHESIATGTLFKNYTAILGLLLRLRQACCHPLLLSKAVEKKDNEVEQEINSNELHDLIWMFASKKTLIPDYIREIPDMDALNTLAPECPICCSEPIQDPVVLKCKHVCCRGCLKDHIGYQNKRDISPPLCHTCRQPFEADDVYEPREIRSTGFTLKDKSLQWNHWNRYQSIKVLVLLEYIQKILSNPSSDKIVIFSQFTGFLDYIGEILNTLRIKHSRFDGRMSQEQRSMSLEQFRNDPTINVLNISLKAGGLGLNLTCANHVLMMDPWWSWSVESQAIDRVYRLGQEKQVVVTRFIVRDSVEERMLKVQERKKFLAGTLGMSKEEQQIQSLEDIQTLFA
ncbi:ATP-dependent chromatin remodeller/ubiquitin-protein ligase E3 Rad8 [Schizosaccharomyces osmophilus]|uniref:ATP-dependent chromatin remodeller/ubiquitin-protein ligase E3 Rad8 n=1 Tax=Schizosaccharomyces osmophilus TaxID=2545709 RepID=A0AAE9WE19_9SCHI|nr:ATP-dependent chromatin remodeller/ubiquitin-protein ligase E3 Rad8 [Schizosaccharomyces osmophilus]WBW74617.1 ATP-dependent chromatin remodeller/ubiquitin-protein ligase E3 Rad8 [Schizosaccharomyces osmophilus]